MDTFRSALVHASYQVLIDLFCHERDHRRCRLTDLNQCCVQSHVSIDLILFHSLSPETFTASSYIPVTHIVYEALKCLCSLRDLVVGQVIVYCLDCGIELRQKPFIHNGQLVVFQCVFCCIEIIDIRIQYEERIGVPQCSHELSLTFYNGFSVETVRKPWCTVDIEVPADRICSVFLQCVERINCISLGLTHLLTILILHVSKYDNVLVWCFVEDQCRDRKQ